MSELDKALEALRQDKRNHENQSRFYDLFLNSDFFVPTEEVFRGEGGGASQRAPLVMESEGNDYLVLFDTRERLFEWGKGEVPHLIVPGYLIAETSTHPLHWVLNPDTARMKIFVPDEIDWLKDAVARCKEENARISQE